MSADGKISYAIPIVGAALGVGAAFIAVFPMSIEFAGNGSLSDLGRNIAAAIVVCAGAGFAIGILLERVLNRRGG